jgi:hypothetical protein
MSSSPSLPVPRRAARLQVAARVAVAVFAGYAFAWGVVAATTSLLFAMHMEFHDAEFMGALLGLLAYLVVFLWTFATRRLARMAALLVVGGALLAGVGSLVQASLVGAG